MTEDTLEFTEWLQDKFISKQKVKEAIEKLTQHPPFYPNSRWIYKEELLKELKL